MSEPTPEQVRVIRKQIEEEELYALVKDTIERLQRLGDRLESYVNEKINIDSMPELRHYDGVTSKDETK